MKKKRIAIFASGSGSNAENISRFFAHHSLAEVVLILTNNQNAGVIPRANTLGISCKVFNRYEFYETGIILSWLKEYQIDLVILAGFLWLIPIHLIKNYPKQIINIHPALLPKYGGKGMYGIRVHEEVIANKETESGISIHYINEVYDAGNIIFQARCKISQKETPETLAEKVHALEYEYFPKIIEKLIKNEED